MFLGIPDKPPFGDSSSVIVLLCELHDGCLLDFVIPMDSLRDMWHMLSRGARQAKVHVHPRGSNPGAHELRIPGGDPAIDLEKFLHRTDLL